MGIHIGDIVGDYRVIGAIGAGGMGAVYKVEHLITKRVEAMKALSTGFGIADEEVRRFEREIQVQARLHHPNIAAVYSAVRHGDVLALVMEYVEGESLRRRLERERLPLDAALSIAADVLAALDCAHRSGVVHGDVSPANIMITPSGSAKLTDFGLARDGSADRLADSGVPVGTAWYMAPEQVRGAGGIDARTDIYAAGAVLHEMLTGRKLFDAEGAFAIMRCHAETAPQPPSAIDRTVPVALDSVVAKAVAKNPAGRFQTAAEFRDAIHRGGAPRRARRRVLMALTAVAAAALFGSAILRPNPGRPASSAPPARPPAPSPVEIIQPHIEEPPGQPAVPRKTVTPAPPKRSVEVKPFTRKNAVLAENARPAENTAPAPPPKSVAPEPAREIDPPPAAADLAALPVADRPATIAAPAIPPPQAEEPKPQKSGNRFFKALGKINPFRRSEKSASPDAKD